MNPAPHRRTPAPHRTAPAPAPATTLTATATTLTGPLVGTGALMAAYLVTRPYGDAPGVTTRAAADAFASPWWVISHLAGVGALACLALVALRVHDLWPDSTSRAARRTGLLGLVLVLPYYGAETFGLHALGRGARDGDPGLLRLVATVREQPVALLTFGLGLLLLAASAVLVGRAWHHLAARPATWPFAVIATLFAPQFALPPVGRIAYGAAYAAAAGLALIALRRLPEHSGHEASVSA